MEDTKKFQGRISFEYFELPDGSWEVKVVVHEESDLPDPSTNLRAYIKMGIMTAQLDSYAKEQLTALELILASKEEMKKIDAKKADVDKYQQKLPFVHGPVGGQVVEFQQRNEEELNEDGVERCPGCGIDLDFEKHEESCKHRKRY